MTDPLADLLALAEKADRFTLITEYGRCTHMDKGEVIAALVRVAMAAQEYFGDDVKSVDLPALLHSLDAALAKGTP